MLLPLLRLRQLSTRLFRAAFGGAGLRHALRRALPDACTQDCSAERAPLFLGRQPRYRLRRRVRLCGDLVAIARR